MKKLIFAIATVFCLQLGLIMYTAFDNDNLGPDAEIAAITMLPQPVAHQEPKTAIADEAGLAGFGPIQERRRTTAAAVRKTARSGKAPIETSKFDPKPVVILYSRKGSVSAPDPDVMTPAESLTGQPTMARIEAPSREKRSFLAKTQPVIRKPYDWLKAIASKLK
jgi:hypothetical protein